MTFQAYLKFLTEQLVTRMDKQDSPETNNRENVYVNHWFGLVPLSWKLWKAK